MKARFARTARARVAPSDKRRFDGVTYATKLEHDRAVHLSLLRKQGTILWVIRQPMIDLCPGITYRPDFLVCERMGDGAVDLYCEDVKGQMALPRDPLQPHKPREIVPRQDADFRRNCRLWLEYEVPFELRIVMRSGKTGWRVDQVISGHDA